MNLVHPPITVDRMRNGVRSIWKAAIELIYWDHGRHAAFNETLDPAREAIIGPGKARGWVVIPKRAKARENIELEYLPALVDGAVALPVRLSVFGVEFYTDVLRRELPESEINPPWPANVWIF
jgi:hypothetical protein